MKKNLFFFLLGISLTSPVFAGSNVIVEGVQMPAWVTHDGHVMPLNVGTALSDKDQIRTGANSRVLLRFSEGSLVKLGENATFDLENAHQQSTGTKLFTATLSVLKGAFRFTTQALSKFGGQRDIKVKFHTVTAGIRGTDIWGRVAPDHDLVALIEGKISVTKDNGEPFEMGEPNTYYLAPKDAEPGLQALPAEQLAKWSLETEITPGEGVIRRGGKWKVNVVQANNQKDALDVYASLEEAGYPAEVRPLKKGEALSYLVRIANLPSKSEADALAAKLKAQLSIAAPTVSK